MCTIKKLRVATLVWCLAFFFSLNLTAQNVSSDDKGFSLSVTADKSDWVYKLGEVPKFKITATQDGKPVKDFKVKYELGLEKLPATKSDSLSLKKGEAVVDAYSLKEAGFLRIVVTAEVGGKKLRSIATAAFEPLTIQPTIKMPEDFNQYWDKAKAELARVPVDAKLELLENRSTANVNVYHLSIQNIGTSRIYGILCVPKKEGKYPAVLHVPGAGVRPYNGDITLAEKGFITLQIGIHGIPVNLPVGVYEDLRTGALKSYNTYNLDDKDNFFYKRVYLGCLRAVDYLTSMPAYDGKNLAVNGGSQGGALAIVTASLDSRVKFLASTYPALADVTGYLYGRAGGWPHYTAGRGAEKHNTPKKLETMQLYDVVNFARQLKVPGFYTWGFNDETCPGTSMYAAYNVITAPKQLSVYKETGHRTNPVQREETVNWLISKLK